MLITKNTRNKYNLRQGNKHNQHYWWKIEKTVFFCAQEENEYCDPVIPIGKMIVSSQTALMQTQAAQGGLTLENVKTTDYGCLKTAEKAAINVEVSWMEWGPLSVTSAEKEIQGKLQETRERVWFANSGKERRNFIEDDSGLWYRVAVASTSKTVFFFL